MPHKNFDYSKIKTVFMDIGGVLLTNGWGHESREKAAHVFNLDYQEMNVLHNFIYNVWEIGSISMDDYLDIVIFHQKRDFSREEFKNFMFDQSQELPKLLEWAKNWKKETEIPVFALSNESQELNSFRIQKFELHHLFDGYFSSSSLGFRKPDPRIFKTALRICQVNSSECIYFDDRLPLINFSKKLGMNSIHHTNLESNKDIHQKLK